MCVRDAEAASEFCTLMLTLRDKLQTLSPGDADLWHLMAQIIEKGSVNKSPQ